MINLNGKTAIITGASRGIGAATAILFAKAGARAIILNYQKDKAAAETVAARCEALGAEVLMIRADVSRPAFVEKMFDKATERFGKVDIMVANAGIWKEAPIETMTEQEWCETIDINLKSIFACCQCAARMMTKQKSGTMILIS